ncbi:MAG: hypothetical protein K5931_03310 [Lachnospiraceae bacterium]|nr:hypothetical protein [Lachnospiraceae bacterium]
MKKKFTKLSVLAISLLLAFSLSACSAEELKDIEGLENIEGLEDILNSDAFADLKDQLNEDLEEGSAKDSEEASEEDSEEIGYSEDADLLKDIIKAASFEEIFKKHDSFTVEYQASEDDLELAAKVFGQYTDLTYAIPGEYYKHTGIYNGEGEDPYVRDYLSMENDVYNFEDGELSREWFPMSKEEMEELRREELTMPDSLPIITDIGDLGLEEVVSVEEKGNNELLVTTHTSEEALAGLDFIPEDWEAPFSEFTYLVDKEDLTLREQCLNIVTGDDTIEIYRLKVSYDEAPPKEYEEFKKSIEDLKKDKDTKTITAVYKPGTDEEKSYELTESTSVKVKLRYPEGFSLSSDPEGKELFKGSDGKSDVTLYLIEDEAEDKKDEKEDKADGDSKDAKDSDKEAKEISASGIVEEEVPLYVGDKDNEEELSLYYIKDGSVPYISCEAIPDLIEKSFSFGYSEEDFYGISTESEDGHFLLTRDDPDVIMDIDFEEDKITFSDFDAFFMKANENLVDVLDPDPKVLKLMKKDEESSVNYSGGLISFDLKSYDIDLVEDEGEYYIPLQTVNDIMLCNYDAYVLRNHEAAFLVDCISNVFNDDSKSEIMDLYKENDLERTEDLAEFEYNELCMILDSRYGLKEEHNIESFDKFLTENGLAEDIKGTDQVKAELALATLMGKYIDDMHSNYMSPSSIADTEDVADALKEAKITRGNAKKAYEALMESYSAASKESYPKGIPGYEEVDNTAYITFNSFSSENKDYDYTKAPKESELDDVVKLMQYSCDQILRKNSPVENVVMDLSQNYGGDNTIATYAMATMLGYGKNNTINTMTAAKTCSVYEIDTNRDGKFDDNDTLAGKGLNLYCLVSPVSFSCGNLLPAEFKTSPEVTLIGKPTAGGTCTINFLSTASGSTLTLSSFKKMCRMHNGIFYNIDQGVEPDYKINKLADFYDREKLTKYINDLY